MVGREYLWTDEALTTASRQKIALDEVDQALHSPPGLRHEFPLGDVLLVIMGMADSARVIAVICEQDQCTTRYRILRLKALRGPELDEWRRRVL